MGTQIWKPYLPSVLHMRRSCPWSAPPRFVWCGQCEPAFNPSSPNPSNPRQPASRPSAQDQDADLPRDQKSPHARLVTLVPCSTPPALTPSLTPTRTLTLSPTLSPTLRSPALPTPPGTALRLLLRAILTLLPLPIRLRPSRLPPRSLPRPLPLPSSLPLLPLPPQLRGRAAL